MAEQEQRVGLPEMARNLDRLTDSIDKLYVALFGNGKDGLITIVAVLESVQTTHETENKTSFGRLWKVVIAGFTGMIALAGVIAAVVK